MTALWALFLQILLLAASFTLPSAAVAAGDRACFAVTRTLGIRCLSERGWTTHNGSLHIAMAVCGGRIHVLRSGADHEEKPDIFRPDNPNGPKLPPPPRLGARHFDSDGDPDRYHLYNELLCPDKAKSDSLTLWVRSNNRQFAVWNGRRWRVFRKGKRWPLIFGRIFESDKFLAIGRDGTVFESLGYAFVVHRADQQTTFRVHYKDGRSDFGIQKDQALDLRHVYVDRQNRVWILSDQGRVFQYVKGRIKSVPNLKARVLAEDRRGRIWIAWHGRIWPLDGKGPIYTLPHIVRGMVVDNRGRVWAVTLDGVYVLAKTARRVLYMANSGIHADDVDSIVVSGWGPDLPPPTRNVGNLWVSLGSRRNRPFVICTIPEKPTKTDPCVGARLRYAGKTNGAGEFTINNIPAGRYYLFYLDSKNIWRRTCTSRNQSFHRRSVTKDQRLHAKPGPVRRRSVLTTNCMHWHRKHD